MKNEKVIHWMTRDPITIAPKTTLLRAYQLLKQFKIRRLPVVDLGKLVGIITLGDIREAKPSSIQAPSLYELNFVLSQLKVESIMTQSPQTISFDATIGQAAQIMLENKIGGLPVVKEDKLIGIITESDIFRLLAQGFSQVEGHPIPLDRSMIDSQVR